MENILSAIEQVASKITSDNIQNIHVKMPDSIALPILNCLPPGPTMIDVTSQSSVASKRSRPKDDDPVSDVDVSAQEALPIKKKIKKTQIPLPLKKRTQISKLATKRVRGSIVVKKLPARRRQKR